MPSPYFILPVCAVILALGVIASMIGPLLRRIDAPDSEATLDDEARAEERGESYLRRIVALTGAKQVGRHYCILNVSQRRFEVHDSYVSCTSEATAVSRGTCFYVPNQRMPVSEKIANALLQLKTNPQIFDRWAAQTGAFKPDGDLFEQPGQNPPQASFLSRICSPS
jgi:hypothetical protein